MDDVTGILKTLLSLTALVDPLGAIPVFLTVTAHQSAQKQRLTARRAALWAFLILLISAAAGKYVLEVFGVSVASMRVAGGILFLFMGIEMLRAEPNRTINEDEVEEETDLKNLIDKLKLKIIFLRFCKANQLNSNSFGQTFIKFQFKNF